MAQSVSDDVAFLSQVTLFANADTDSLTRLSYLLKLHRYRRGEIIFHEDDPPGSLFLVKSGLVKVQLSSSDDKHLTIAWVRPLNFFGTISSVRGVPRPEAAIALEPTEALVLQREDLRAFLQEHPETALVFIDLLAARWLAGLELLQDVAFREVPGRLAKILLRKGRAASQLTTCGDEYNFLAPSQAELAALVGATRESVNKSMQRFVHSGAIAYDGKHIRVLDPDALAQYLT